MAALPQQTEMGAVGEDRGPFRLLYGATTVADIMAAWGQPFLGRAIDREFDEMYAETAAEGVGKYVRAVDDVIRAYPIIDFDAASGAERALREYIVHAELILRRLGGSGDARLAAAVARASAAFERVERIMLTGGRADTTAMDDDDIVSDEYKFPRDCVHACRARVYLPGRHAKTLVSEQRSSTSTKPTVYLIDASGPDGGAELEALKAVSPSGNASSPSLVQLAAKCGALVLKSAVVALGDAVLPNDDDLRRMFAHKNMFEQLVNEVANGVVLRDLVTLGLDGITAIFGMTYDASLCHGVPARHDGRAGPIFVDIFQEMCGESFATVIRNVGNSRNVRPGNVSPKLLALNMLIGAMAQLVHGLDVAFSAVNFVHYDLNMNNIRLRQLPPGAAGARIVLRRLYGDAHVIVPPEFSNGMYLKLIDFGRSHCNYLASPGLLHEISARHPVVAALYRSRPPERDVSPPGGANVSMPIPVTVQLRPETAEARQGEWKLGMHGRAGVHHCSGLWRIGIPWDATMALPSSDDAHIAFNICSLTNELLLDHSGNPTSGERGRIIKAACTVAAACDALYLIDDPFDPALLLGLELVIERIESWYGSGNTQETETAMVQKLTAKWLAAEIVWRMTGPGGTKIGLFAAISDLIILLTTAEQPFRINVFTRMSERQASGLAAFVASQTVTLANQLEKQLVFVGPIETKQDVETRSDILSYVRNGAAHLYEHLDGATKLKPYLVVTRVVAECLSGMLSGIRKYVAGMRYVPRAHIAQAASSSARSACLDVLARHMAQILVAPDSGAIDLLSLSLPFSVEPAGPNTAKWGAASIISAPLTEPDSDGAVCSFDGCDAIAAFGCGNHCRAQVMYCSERHRDMHWLSGHISTH